MDYSFIIFGLTIISIIITLASRLFLTNSYNKYMLINNQRNITGFEATRKILDKHNLYDIKIVETKGYQNNNYNPKNKTIKLSSDVYYGKSITSVCIALHECSHAIQDKEKYLPMRIRSKLIPIVNFSTYIGYITILLGCIFGIFNLIYLGIIVEIIILIFQIITLPTEIDASHRALQELDYSHYFNSKELKQGKIVLTSASLTYVSSLITTLMQVLKLIFILRRKEN